MKMLIFNKCTKYLRVQLPILRDCLVKFLYPNQCLLCEEQIAEDSTFCLDHYNQIKFISFPSCQICSKPIKNESSEELRCAKCLHESPSYQSSIILFAYEKVVSGMILSLKYHDNTYICKKLGRMFAQRFIRDTTEDFDIIAAVPLHKKRIKARKYNQSVILGKHIGKNIAGVRFVSDLLVRTKFSKTQENLNEKERNENLKNAFIVNKKYHDFVKGKNIILVDDVVTTGATIENCSLALKSQNSGHIKIMAIAKTTLDFQV